MPAVFLSICVVVGGSYVQFLGGDDDDDDDDNELT